MTNSLQSYFCVSAVPGPARIPDLISAQSDRVLPGTLNGPSAAFRRARQEESARYRLWCYPKISQWTTQTSGMCFMRMFGIIFMCCTGSARPLWWRLLFSQERYEEWHREPRLTLRPPSLAAPYAPVQNWHHQPEKLIFESCAYEANVHWRLPHFLYEFSVSLNICTISDAFSSVCF